MERCLAVCRDRTSFAVNSDSFFEGLLDSRPEINRPDLSMLELSSQQLANWRNICHIYYRYCSHSEVEIYKESVYQDCCGMDCPYAGCIGNILFAIAFCEMGLMFGLKEIFANNSPIILLGEE